MEFPVAAPRINRRVFATPDALHAALQTHIAALAAEAIAVRGEFSIVLTGGTTVLPLYQRLRDIDTRWPAWRVFWSDERCVAVDDEMRNSKAALTTWLAHVPIPADRIHVIPAEQGAETAASDYAGLLANRELFDLVLLSLGEDGHVASLFPGNPLGDEPGAAPVLAVQNSPKAPAQRVSMGLRRLCACRNLLVIATGEAKRSAVRKWRDGEDSPVARLSSAIDVDAWLDAAASCDLSVGCSLGANPENSRCQPTKPPRTPNEQRWYD